jgi:hypothetical protein
MIDYSPSLASMYVLNDDSIAVMMSLVSYYSNSSLLPCSSESMQSHIAMCDCSVWYSGCTYSANVLFKILFNSTIWLNAQKFGTVPQGHWNTMKLSKTLFTEDLLTGLSRVPQCVTLWSTDFIYSRHVLIASWHEGIICQALIFGVSRDRGRLHDEYRRYVSCCSGIWQTARAEKRKYGLNGCFNTNPWQWRRN